MVIGKLECWRSGCFRVHDGRMYHYLDDKKAVDVLVDAKEQKSEWKPVVFGPGPGGYSLKTADGLRVEEGMTVKVFDRPTDHENVLDLASRRGG